MMVRRPAQGAGKGGNDDLRADPKQTRLIGIDPGSQST
jgi:hypothetical protein